MKKLLFPLMALGFSTAMIASAPKPAPKAQAKPPAQQHIQAAPKKPAVPAQQPPNPLGLYIQQAFKGK